MKLDRPYLKTGKIRGPIRVREVEETKEILHWVMRDLKVLDGNVGQQRLAHNTQMGDFVEGFTLYSW